MIKDNLKEKAHTIVEIARAQGIIIKYEDWCNTSEAKDYALDDEEIEHYEAKNNGGR